MHLQSNDGSAMGGATIPSAPPSVVLQGDEGSIHSTPAKEAFRAMKIQPVGPSIILSYMNCCPAQAHCASPPTEPRPKMETGELDCCISTRHREVYCTIAVLQAGVSFKGSTITSLVKGNGKHS